MADTRVNVHDMYITQMGSSCCVPLFGIFCIWDGRRGRCVMGECSSRSIIVLKSACRRRGVNVRKLPNLF